ncbi:protein tamozhennic-like [Atheta coriaria]|uniref:protein tamozhennic-like n=1 Tax=Dalotia coriaria TaxID=877792 RepID=UPI0031F3CE74
MDTYYNNTQRQQYSPGMLWSKINSLHLSYLEMEASPEKIKHKSKLEEYIHRYLCEAHHNQKFECTSTPKVLHESAARMTDFSGYKAALGWDAIGRYAANLLTKPWRKEYRQIKMYSGFYKHEVESNLVGADAMFVEMGYKPMDNQQLILTGPVCPDRLASVSLDSIMAYVECQILKEIWEEVSQVYNVTWLDVLNMREMYAGSPQETIDGVMHMKKLPSPKAMHSYYTQPPPPPQPQYMYGPSTMMPPHTCCGNFYMHNAPYPGYYYPSQPQMSHMHHPAGSGCSHATVNAPAVPTARLIEYDGFDQPDGRVDEVQKHLGQMYLNDAPTAKSASERDDGSGTYESWDYVYRNLESQGYSKDLGNAGFTQSQNTAHARPKSKHADESKREKRENRHSTYDNVSDKPVKAKTSVEPVVPVAPTPSSNTQPAQSRQNNGHAELAVAPSASTSQPATSKGWHCTTCTFLNQNEKDICAMCSKSRKKPMEEHLQVGGTQCEKCTYVNGKGQKICSMCSSSLNNSPTYI